MQVTLIDKMGDDLRVVNAARVSFNKESEWEITRKIGAVSVDREINLSEQDKKLINYLAKHDHFTPFTHVVLTLREKVPIFVARQRFKHTIGFSYNEISRRYVDDPPEFFTPTEWRSAPVNAKQGSGSEVITKINWEHDLSFGQSPIDDLYKRLIHNAELLYNDLIKGGVAPEQARMVLPQSMMTEYYSTGSLAAWARATNLRKDNHAQKEIQDLARMWDEIIRGLPELEHSWRALVGEKWY